MATAGGNPGKSRVPDCPTVTNHHNFSREIVKLMGAVHDTPIGNKRDKFWGKAGKRQSHLVPFQ